MRILVTGAHGQLGEALVNSAKQNGNEVIGLGRDELDLSELDLIPGEISKYCADWVVNCAAYTHVDLAEENADQAYRINRDAAKAIAQGAKNSGSRLLHVSTDFIFSGNQREPYQEDDQSDAVNVYGKSKYEGELVVAKELPKALIMRTAWVYSAQGSNFVKTMLRLIAERDEVRVVDDQFGSPSWTVDISRAMQALMKNNVAGVYHYTNDGVTSWYDFACEILSFAQALGYPVRAKKLIPISSSEWSSAAVRPAYSVLSTRKISPTLDYDIPHWKQSLSNMLTEYAP